MSYFYDIPEAEYLSLLKGENEDDIIHACGLKLFCMNPIYPKRETPKHDLLLLKDALQRRLWEGRIQRGSFKRIIELGVFGGGSLPWLFELCDAEFIVGIDLLKGRSKLPQILDSTEMNGKYALYFGTDQSDPKALNKIVKSHFVQGLDLVVDDASHFLHLTRRSFEILFPKLRSGGLYVIEDYGWAHRGGPEWHPFEDNYPAMSQIILELTMLMATNRTWISDILIDHNTITVVRGAGELPQPFRVKDSILNWAGVHMPSLRALGVFKPSNSN